MSTLSLDRLSSAVQGGFAAIRRTTTLQPIGEKIFPPTYEGGKYAFEDRQVNGESIKTVLLDSVQSQANRMELALLSAVKQGRLHLPLLTVDFAVNAPEDSILNTIGQLTSLETPHRMCDAIFRDSEYEGTAFRKTSIGARLNSAGAANATPVLELCPTALLFGFWDSTGPLGGLGAKLQRALVSEIVGYAMQAGVRPTSRIDPLQIQNNVEIFKAGSSWTMDSDEADKKSGKSVVIKPSEVNHGNIAPSLQNKDKAPNHGGVTMSHAVQHTVLSLAALRRLRFPVNGVSQTAADVAARTVLAALALAAVALLDDEGYDLRSRCLLDGKPAPFEFVGRGETEAFTLSSTEACELFQQAAAQLSAHNLPWNPGPIQLVPSAKLARLVAESRSKAAASSEDGE